jgi:hypothetical protein
MFLASGQLRLQAVQAQVAQAQSAWSAGIEEVTAMEAPSRIAVDAGLLHLVQPSQVLQLPSVSLAHPLAAPALSYAPCCSLNPGR